MASVSVIIVNYNAGDRLLRCLAAVMAQTAPPLEVLLVDNGSEDGSFEKALEAFPTVRGLPMGKNLGFAAANNRASEEAKGDWLALLNPDAYPEPSWLEELLSATERWSEAQAFGSLQLNSEDLSIIDGAGDNLHALGVPYRGHLDWPASKAPAEGEVFAPCAAAALYAKAEFLQLGGFDERFFCYCEDVDLGARLRHRDGLSVQVPTAVVRHEGSAITGRQSAFTVFHGHRNRIWLTAKSLPPLLFWGLLPAQLLVHLLFICKFAPTPIGRDYRRAIAAGLKEIPRLRRERRGRPSLSSAAFAKLLVWSPIALMQRKAKIVGGPDNRR
ncbi:glycosyltransferase family 2 protein [Parvularcula sp. ZS-1/3]|uniref:Glycosyltransferase family 2 protein n=1 Tax=Parvularcula mediterranea TaxID=2732508 RepID=A0A7Y3RIH0_9PROT|nr:glycosyltransferase family 2 protein [Parvularcula mediterranea]